MKQKSKVTADLKKNLLQITLVDALTVKVLQEIYTDIRFCVADLKPGFTVITDLSQCQIGHLAGLGTFARIREHLEKNKVGTVIRVTRKTQLIFHQISKIICKKSSYPIIYVGSLEEAHSRLNDLTSQNIAALQDAI